MLKPFFGALVFFLFLCVHGCIPHRAFVATPYEPVLVKKKGDMEVSAGIRPMKYFSLSGTIAASDNVAIRMGYGGFFGLDNFNASLIFFKNAGKYGFFVAPSFSYQHNTIHRGVPGIFFDRKIYAYNCEYSSPGIVLGYKIATDPEDASHQFILKAQYNIVSKYNYEFQKSEVSSLNGTYLTRDHETLHQGIPSFWSFEPSYVFLVPFGPVFTVKGQLSALICQQTFKHNYEFNDDYYSGGSLHNGTIVEMSKLHPVYFPVNLSAGLILNISSKEKKHFDPKSFEW